MTKPQYIKPPVLEQHDCPHHNPAWRGCPPAEITLGRYEDGRWATGHGMLLSNGSGFGHPIGHWTDGARVTFASRDEALEAASARITASLDRAPDSLSAEVRRIKDWLAGLQQRDLFAAFA